MKHTSWLSLPIATFGCLIPLSTQAQVTPDGTTSTTVNGDGNNFTIEQGDRVGDNLFHSFNEFSVPTLGSAVFNNAGDIANIFSRVTGGSISNIDGILGAMGTANLFLINPNGIIFGENASLNLGGSFFASTADSLLFEGDTEFSAVNPEAPPLLEVSIPIGARFRDNPGDITNFSFAQNNTGEFVGLEVLPGKSLTLLGGDINFDAGEATAKGGNIFLGGLAEAGTVALNQDGSLIFPDNLTLADISLTNVAEIEVTGIGIGGGNIAINARNLRLEAGEFGQSGIVAGTAASENSSTPEAQSGNINIDVTDNININNSVIFNRVNPGATGNAGNIFIDTSSLSVVNGGTILTNTSGTGDTGIVEINAADNITISGVNSQGFGGQVGSRVDIGAEGNSGDVIINTNSLLLNDGAQIDANTFGLGNAGSLKIDVADSIVIDGNDLGGFASSINSQIAPGAEGNLGKVSIATNSLSLTNGGRISADVLGKGNGGSIEINSTNFILADGEDISGFPSGITSGIGLEAEGNAGNISINTASLSLTNGGRVSANAFGQGNSGLVEITATDVITIDGQRPNGDGAVSGVTSQAFQGSAEGVRINTTSLSLTNGGQIDATTFGQGNAGLVEINASDFIIFNGDDLRGNPSGASSQVGPGAEGNSEGVIIDTNSLSLTDGGRVSATTFGQGNAGSVNITSTDSIAFDGEDSRGNASGVSSGVNPGAEGNAGGVIIDTDSLSLTNGGQIDASTRGLGNAGSIEIKANNIFVSGDRISGVPSGITSLVLFTAEGSAGDVIIDTDSLSLISGGEVNVGTFNQGNAGDIIINATESIFIDGTTNFVRSGISSNALISNSDSGDVNVSTNQLTIDKGGTIEAGNFDSSGIFEPGIGQPGNINIEADSLNLNNGATIEAATQFTQSTEVGSANINLNISEDIILENNSFISARALANATGGNVTINANNGFVLAFPAQNNDIIANASEGRGGAIDITTQAIFGLEERPLNFITNDINASSQATGLDGSVDINNPAVDPTTGLIDLPASVGDASDQISQNPCQQGIGSQFIVTGKGGLPPNPTETLESDRITVDLVEPLLREGDEETKEQAGKLEEDSVTETVPAMGWIFNDKGEVTLTAYSNTDTERERLPSGYASRTQQHRTACHNISP